AVTAVFPTPPLPDTDTTKAKIFAYSEDGGLRIIYLGGAPILIFGVPHGGYLQASQAGFQGP
ncbi:MAG: hypothetical protein ACP5QI_08505, partial [Candidatus Bathyarchaeia archaeon]